MCLVNTTAGGSGSCLSPLQLRNDGWGMTRTPGPLWPKVGGLGGVRGYAFICHRLFASPAEVAIFGSSMARQVLRHYALKLFTAD